MLSNNTRDYLNDLAAVSDALYQEGGVYYKYDYGHRIAHIELDRVNGKVQENYIQTIELFWESALSTPYPESSTPRTREICAKLLVMLNDDFKGFVGPKVFLTEDCVGKVISILFTCNNDYHHLELSWSID